MAREVVALLEVEVKAEASAAAVAVVHIAPSRLQTRESDPCPALIHGN